MHKTFVDAAQEANERADNVSSAEENIRYGVDEVARIVARKDVDHFELVRIIERMYRRYLDRLRVDLIRLGADDISPSHAMLLFTIGDDDLSVRDLMDRGHYLGSNASYSLKQLVQSGYVDRTASPRDRRSARIRLTDKGKRLCEAIRAADEFNQDLIVRDEQDHNAFEETLRMLRRLEVLWATDLQQKQRPFCHQQVLTGNEATCTSCSCTGTVPGNSCTLPAGSCLKDGQQPFCRKAPTGQCLACGCFAIRTGNLRRERQIAPTARRCLMSMQAAGLPAYWTI
ncbi:winged helix DNA-binding protein [Roseibium salinum]|nr:winged helix DNA-binding protein [Roseibium salinum]